MRKPSVKSVLNIAVTLLVAYLVVMVLLRLFEKQFIFFPNYAGRLSGNWEPAGLPVESVNVSHCGPIITTIARQAPIARSIARS